ncbi:MAG: cellulase family glycosylhydrolase [Sandaracinus sp.]
MRRFSAALVALFALACSSPPLAPWSPPADEFVRSDRHHLRDATGRVMVFRGVNARVEGIFDVTLDPVRCPPPTDVLEDIPALEAADFARMRAIGFDVLRLPIQWSAIEPARGSYDEAYLARVEDLVALAASYDVRVLIDFHADAWSKDLGEDGAPLWATLPPPAPEDLLCGPLESLDTRRTATLDEYAAFFDPNDPAALALQDDFGRMAAHVAERFAGEPNVIGYDLFNEPLPSDANIQRFYARILPAIRAVDARHLAFFEPSALRNLTDMGPRPSGAFPDEGGVYAVHLYTLSFSDPRHELDTVTRARLEPNVTRARAEAEAFEVPLFAGEWGVRPDSPGSAPYVGFLYDLFDEASASSTVWLWKESSQGGWGFYDYDAATDAFTERPEVFDAHTRVWAEVIAGEPTTAHYDREAHALTLSFEGRGDLAPHVIRVPTSFASFTASCDGAPIAEATREATTGRVEAICAGPGTHTLVVTAIP